MKLRRLLAAHKELLLVVAGLVCLTVAAALVAAPLGWAAAGVSFIAMDLVMPDSNGDGR